MQCSLGCFFIYMFEYQCYSSSCFGLCILESRKARCEVYFAKVKFLILLVPVPLYFEQVKSMGAMIERAEMETSTRFGEQAVCADDRI